MKSDELAIIKPFFKNTEAMNNAHHYLQQAYHGNADTAYVLSEDWAQGRAGFGGLLAGMMIAAMRREIPQERALQSMSCSFVGPVTMGEPFSIQTQLLRSGKNAVQMQAQISQNDAIQTVVVASFGLPRESAAQMPAEAAPSAHDPDGLPSMPFIPNIVPNFVQHFDMRWVFGGLPYFGQGTREMGGWWRYRDFDAAQTSAVLSEAHYVTLLDAWPPAILPLINRPAPASTMTWFAQFVQPLPVFAGAWMLYRAEIAHAAHGYGQTQAHIWSASGELLMVSSQTVAVFD